MPHGDACLASHHPCLLLCHMVKQAESPLPTWLYSIYCCIKDLRCSATHGCAAAPAAKLLCCVQHSLRVCRSRHGRPCYLHRGRLDRPHSYHSCSAGRIAVHSCYQRMH
jgi:hypothetical protein